MKDSVSSRRLSVFPLVAALSVVWVASSIFIPYGFPWTGLAWGALALSLALWRVKSGGTRSIAQILRDFDARAGTGGGQEDPAPRGADDLGVHCLPEPCARPLVCRNVRSGQTSPRARAAGRPAIARG